MWATSMNCLQFTTKDNLFIFFFLHQLILIIFQSDRMLPGTGIVLTALGIFILGYLPTDQITGILIITRV